MPMASSVGVTNNRPQRNASLIQSACAAPAPIPTRHTSGTVAKIPKTHNTAHGITPTHQIGDSFATRKTVADPVSKRRDWQMPEFM